MTQNTSEIRGKIPSSIILEDYSDINEINTPDYTEEEIEYLGKLQKRLEKAKMMREYPQTAFDDMTYEEYWQKCEDLANVKIKPKENKYDIQYSSGTLRTKMFAFLSSLQGLNLSPDILAFDKSDVIMGNLGNAIEDIIEKTEEIDEDEEKKLIRQYELLKHGTIFIEEIWNNKKIIEKDIIDNYKGQFRGVKINKKEITPVGNPERNIISGLSVYLGDMTKYLISDQPYIFTAQTITYDEAKKTYGQFENWKYVSKTLRNWSGDTDKAMENNAWRLLDSREGMVEVIKYSDKPNNEYQIILNGVPMLPLGFPFPWGYEEYNITQQNLKPIRQDFSYGKSFLFENKNLIQFLDELLKLALLKTKKSFLPPYINISGRVISSQVLMPGKITMGIPPGSLIPVSERDVSGVTSGEFNMIQEIIKQIDQQTASQTFTGSRERGGNVTATQIIELQKQSRIMMGVIIISAALMEKKLTTLRLMNILKNWFDPIDEELNDARTLLKDRYRIISRRKSIEGKGVGLRLVVPTEEKITPDQIKEEEDKMEKDLGMPVRITTLKPKELKQAKITWIVSINPREKKSSEMNKLMFKSMITDALSLGLIPDPSFIEERFAETWGEDPARMFKKQETDMAQMQEMMGGQPGTQPETANIGQGITMPQGITEDASPTIKKPRLELSPGPTGPGEGGV